jgi:hypothetical protein
VGVLQPLDRNLQIERDGHADANRQGDRARTSTNEATGRGMKSVSGPLVYEEF